MNRVQLGQRSEVDVTAGQRMLDLGNRAGAAKEQSP